MASDNVALVESSYVAAEAALREAQDYYPRDLATGVADGELPALTSYLAEFVHEQMSWEPLWSQRPFLGYAGVIQYIADFMELMDDWSWENSEFSAHGDAVIGVFRVLVTGRGSGAAVSQTIAIAYRVRDRRLVLYQEHPDKRSAMAALDHAAA